MAQITPLSGKRANAGDIFDFEGVTCVFDQASANVYKQWLDKLYHVSPDMELLFRTTQGGTKYVKCKDIRTCFK